MRHRRVDPNGKEPEEKLGQVGEGKTIIKITYVRESFKRKEGEDIVVTLHKFASFTESFKLFPGTAF